MLGLACIPAPAAIQNVVVSATVPSATSIDASGCVSASAATGLGTVLPGTGATTTSDCVVSFGSSNDTAALRVTQGDGTGAAMYRFTDGTPDTGFAPGGSTSYDFSGAARADELRDAIVLPGGDVIAVGMAFNGTDEDLLLVRIRSDGSLAAGFGTSGIVRIDLGGSQTLDAVTLDARGRVVAAGSHAADPLIGRFDAATGAFDGSFGVGGWRSYAGSFTETCIAVEVHSNGTISCIGGVGSSATFIMRLTDAGVWDTTFTGDGYERPANTPAVQAATFDSAGRYLIAVNQGLAFAVQRHLPDGSLDPAWGVSGVATYDGALDEDVLGVGIDGAGRVLAAGHTPGRDSLVVRFTTAGVPDASFGTAGGVGWGGGGDDAQHRVLPQSDGDILVAGYDGSFTVVRLNQDGSFDTAFGEQPGTPRMTTLAGGGGVREILATSDGRVMLVGTNGADGRVAQLSAVTMAQFSPGVDDWDQGAGVFGACLRSVAGATASWTMSGSCSATDADPWRAVPPSGDSSSVVARTTVAGTLGASAGLRFGMRAPANQPPGSYSAPLEFTVVAPGA